MLATLASRGKDCHAHACQGDDREYDATAPRYCMDGLIRVIRGSLIGGWRFCLGLITVGFDWVGRKGIDFVDYAFLLFYLVVTYFK